MRPMNERKSLDDVAGVVRTEFEEGNRILGFGDWLDLFSESPYRMSRSAPVWAISR